MVTGFMAGVALGQQLVGMSKKKPKMLTREKKLQSAKIAAYKRMQARQKQATFYSTLPALTTQEEIIKQQRRGAGRRSNSNSTA